MCHFYLLFYYLNSVDTLLNFQSEIKISLEREMKTMTTPEKKKITVHNDEIIKKKWAQLKNGLDPNIFINEIVDELKHGKFTKDVITTEEGKQNFMFEITVYKT